MAGTIEERLAELAGSEAPAVTRFDAGEGLRGGWAVLPSAFNPPTRAHLRLLDLAQGVVGVTGGAALLTTRNVAKGVEGASLEDRIGMLLAARESRSGLAVLGANQARIVDQAAGLRDAWPEASFDFVLGYDTLIRLFDEQYYDGPMEVVLDPFFERHRVIAANRGEVTPGAMREWVAEQASRYADRIITMALDEEHGRISSSEIRARIEAGEGSDDLPEGVADYIRERGLYKGA
ncbi:MAG: nicotinate-nicotinamide nucleotide adenylyltransferase [Chloroflexi bacterium]|nr:nicotinate-nicotinamide nucleotide adenylyltransferase [Chloroflexota bacterium]